MEKKTIARRGRVRSVEALYPLVCYLKKYLRETKPGMAATEIEKKRYAVAVAGVREMETIILSIDKQLVGCYVGAPRVPRELRIM